MQCDKAIAKASLASNLTRILTLKSGWSTPPCSLFTFLNLKCFPILCLVDETRSEHYDIIFLLGTEMDF